LPLLGSAAIVITSQMADAPAHDHWHSHEHLPERIGIEGFLRARRLVADDGREPRYLVVYEVASAAVMDSPAYMQRLNQPSEWSRRMMAQNLGLGRSLCRTAISCGLGVGSTALALVIDAPDAALHDHLAEHRLPALVQEPGLTGAHLLLRDRTKDRPPSEEERLRGRPDASLDALLLVEGYDRGALERARGALADELRVSSARLYHLAHLLGRDEAQP
jgi:hypothetical protein